MNCPNCNHPMRVVGKNWMCGRHDPPVCLPVDSVAVGTGLSDFSDIDLSALPYPVALTACRLGDAIKSSADALKTLFVLKDCFEATIKYLGVMLLTEYFRSPACKPERNATLLEKGGPPVAGRVGSGGCW